MPDINSILNDNPLYYVFTDANGLAWVTAIAAIIALFAVLAKKNDTAAAIVGIGALVTTLVAICLTIENNNIASTGILAIGLPCLMGAAGLALLGLAGMTAWHNYSGWAKVILISTYSLCAALAGLFGSASMRNLYEASGSGYTPWLQWSSVMNYMYGAVFVLMVATALMLVIGVLFIHSQWLKTSFATTRRWVSGSTERDKAGQIRAEVSTR